MTNNMKKIRYILLTIMISLALGINAQITFSFGSSPNVSANLREKIDRNISSLLTEINRAGMAGT